MADLSPHSETTATTSGSHSNIDLIKEIANLKDCVNILLKERQSGAKRSRSSSPEEVTPP